MANPRFFVNKITGSSCVISGDDFSHLVSVLRKEKGDSVIVFNYGCGEFEAVIESIDTKAREAVLKTVKKIRDAGTRRVYISAVMALIKNDRMEFVLEKLTELGVDEIIPLAASRAVVKIKDSEKKKERWERIIYSAVKQSGRIKEPSLSPVVDSVKMLLPVKGSTAGFFAWEREDKKMLIDSAIKKIPGADSVIFVIGPEGGFEEAEAAELIKKGYEAVSLGNNTLRAETAAIAAASVIIQASEAINWND